MTSEDRKNSQQPQGGKAPWVRTENVFDTRRANVRRSNLRHELLQQRYLLKDNRGRVVETPRQMFHRVAQAVSLAEKRYGSVMSEVKATADKFFHLMSKGYFLPNSPTIMNTGRENGILSACFVLPVEDSIEGIFDAIKHTALIQKAGGGTGFAFDSLRPTGDRVASSGGKTSGPISFMRVFAEATRAIQQGAFRRGANMAMMSVEHPDILRFITAKRPLGAFENFNLSVKITDAFMEQLCKQPDAPYVVTNRRTGKRYVIPNSIDTALYTLQDLLPCDQANEHCYSVCDVWQLIVSCAHSTGEPGVCFIDRMNEDNPTPVLGRIEATNPCAEQPLLPYESCNLGSINLAKFVEPDQRKINWHKFGRTIKYAVRFLDNVIDVNHYPIPHIRDITLGNRKIGLGIMGFADALVLLGIRYDSNEAVEFAEKVSRFLTDQAHEASRKLAEDRGVFPNWAGSTWDKKYHRPMRNAACTTIAPTGSLSIIGGCSSGIEPIFSLVTNRRALGVQEFIEVHPLIEWLGEREGWMDNRVRAALLEGVPPKEIRGFPKQLAELFVTAHEVPPEWHVKLQTAFQKQIDNAVSKTVNLPDDAREEDVDRIFRLAHELGCKGITVYRDGSHENQTLSSAGKTSRLTVATGKSSRPRVRVTHGQTLEFHTRCGALFVTVNRDEEGLCEVFANTGNAGWCPSQYEATCRVVSVALRSGVSPKVLVEHLKGIRGLSVCVADKCSKCADVLSCSDAIARAIEEVMGESSERILGSKERIRLDCGQTLHCQPTGCFACQNR